MRKNHQRLNQLSTGLRRDLPLARLQLPGRAYECRCGSTISVGPGPLTDLLGRQRRPGCRVSVTATVAGNGPPAGSLNKMVEDTHRTACTKTFPSRCLAVAIGNRSKTNIVGLDAKRERQCPGVNKPSTPVSKAFSRLHARIDTVIANCVAGMEMSGRLDHPYYGNCISHPRHRKLRYTSPHAWTCAFLRRISA
jgi:hypothetical protein